MSSDEAGAVPQWLRRTAGWGWRLLVLGALVYYVALSVDHIQVVVIPLVLAIIMAAVFWPAADWMTKHRCPRPLAAGLLVLVTLLLWLGLLAPLFVKVAQEADTAPEMFQRAMERLPSTLANLPGVDEEAAARGVTQARDHLRDHSGELGSSLMRGASTAFNVGAGALLLLVFAFFFLKDGRDIRDGIVRFVPGDAHWQRWKPAAAEIWMTLGRYVRGVTIVAAFDAILMGLALWAIGVPMIWAIMAITFVGAFIPLAGPVIATVVAVIAALGDGGMTDALLVIGAGITVQLIEGNVLQPYVMGRSVRVHPVVVLAAVAVGAIVWGIPGALLAVPAAATAIIILHHVTGTTADSESAATDGA